VYLSSLEIQGFKSFPERTKVEFASGITGVVGPNGCGKTNILDAIRWVLGEQRSSILRGSKMEDVIFSGTREYKPLGMAEVSLTVVNDKQVLPTEYSSITITRRLFRSGESEYLLNKVSCRLRDILDLFADTGMGSHAYSIIQLAQVEAILSDKADQRRMLFEEAAGITRYKSRKKAALRKLEATENDLLRLTDILAEVSTQVNSLGRQMKKAERYRTLQDRISNAALLLLKDSCRKITDQLASVRNEKKTNEIHLAQANAELDKWDLAREEISGRLLEISDEQRGLRRESEEVQNSCHQLESEISVLEEKINSADEADRRESAEIETIGAKLENLNRERSQLQDKLQELEETLSLSEEEAKVRERELKETLAALEQARRSSQSAQEDLFEFEGKQNICQHTAGQLATRLSEFESSISEHQERLSECDNAIDKSHALETENTEGEQRLQQRLDRLSQYLNDLRSELEHLNRDSETLATKSAEARLRVRSLETHVTLKEKMILSYEGYGSGVSAVFSEEADLPGVIDTVANLLHAKERYVAVVEMALAETAEYIVVRTREDAERAIGYLQSGNLGRASFLIYSEIESGDANCDNSQPHNCDGFISRAIDLVDVTPQYRQVAELLLGDVLIFRDHSSAARALQEASVQYPIVTLDGHSFKATAIHQGGSQGEILLLGRETELEKLKSQLSNAEAELSQLFARNTEFQNRRSEITDEIADTRKSTGELEPQLTELRLKAARDDEQKRQLLSQRERIVAELEADKQRLNDHLREREQLEDDSARLHGDTSGARTALMGTREQVEQLERDTNTANREHEDVQLRIIRLQTELQSLKDNTERTRQLAVELETGREDRLRAQSQRKSDIEQFKNNIERNHELLTEQLSKRTGLKEEEDRVVLRQGELAEKQSEYEQLLRAARREQEQSTQRYQESQLSETELKARYEDIRRQLWDSFEVRSEELTLPEPLVPERVSELEEELSADRQRQQNLGMVNMLALEEYDREAQRERFLKTQLDDLTEAKDNLRATITRINSTARRLFLETFDQVKENFKQVFGELFQGGEADLLLEDESDPLESPIVISARPRGKRFLGISQLSGGERALTAISLLFGIYLTKPSPFCVLDEVDAPLDDANVGRFLRMVRTFAENTQFIIITHNKRTMEKCARLYGVTMAKPGVSQLVSVDFEKLDRRDATDALTYVQPEASEVVEDNIQAESILIPDSATESHQAEENSPTQNRIRNELAEVDVDTSDDTS